ncbi:hypothetical protein BFJ69_g8757 [Fusarium oxysporum]|uniref:Uncharacterized protein n=1 Tax=Fusarium oxysporum TaxID=5507 RepID=A0A420N1L4_FUSOX|nr:hypothetical protein BFJ69_g8757 [Fusarium oxysporum]
MCYANLGTLICQACGRRVGEQPVGTSPCLTVCGKYVSRVTGTVVSGECGQVTHQSSNAALFNPPSHLGIQALSRAKWHCLQLSSYGMVIPVRKPELIQ